MATFDPRPPTPDPGMESCARWWPVVARGGPWWPVVARGGPWWPVVARGGPWWPVVAGVAGVADRRMGRQFHMKPLRQSHL